MGMRHLSAAVIALEVRGRIGAAKRTPLLHPGLVGVVRLPRRGAYTLTIRAMGAQPEKLFRLQRMTLEPVE